MDKYLFSVIIPVYNGQKYIKRCIESLLKSDYTDFEILLINDGSTDKTKELCDEYADRYECIRAFHKENMGSTEARAYGIEYVQGEYVTFCDVDDYVDARYFEVLHNAVQTKADYYILNNYLNKRGTDEFYVEKDCLDTQYIEDIRQIYELFSTGKIAAVWDKIYNREILKQIRNNLKVSIVTMDDIYINLHYMKYIKNAYIADEAVYYHFSDSPTSVSAVNKYKISYLSDINKVYTLAEKELTDKISKSSKEQFIDQRIGAYVIVYGGLLRKKNDKKMLLQESRNHEIKKCKIGNAVGFKAKIYRMVLKYNMMGMMQIVNKMYCKKCLEKI